MKARDLTVKHLHTFSINVIMADQFPRTLFHEKFELFPRATKRFVTCCFFTCLLEKQTRLCCQSIDLLIFMHF